MRHTLRNSRTASSFRTCPAIRDQSTIFPLLFQCRPMAALPSCFIAAMARTPRQRNSRSPSSIWKPMNSPTFRTIASAVKPAKRISSAWLLDSTASTFSRPWLLSPIPSANRRTAPATVSRCTPSRTDASLRIDSCRCHLVTRSQGETFAVRNSGMLPILQAWRSR
jgi:hypothetical protein